MNQYALVDILPTYPPDLQRLVDFLQRHQLRYEHDIDFALGMEDDDQHLICCGCCAGNILKCFAIDDACQGENLLGTLVPQLMSNRFSMGYSHLFLFTKPDKIPAFCGCGFHLVAQTPHVAMLENLSNGLEQFLRRLPALSKAGETGAIIMNCNPFTWGHRHLIEYAAAHCQTLHIFAVEEDRSVFPFSVRFRLLQEGTADLPHVAVHPGGPYIISGATFPTYFLKRAEDGAEEQARLDLTVFAETIAPRLGIQVRFIGSEPACPVTASYNRMMMEMLPPAGIRVCEIPRITTAGGEIISASAVREELKRLSPGAWLKDLVPPCTLRYLCSEEAAPGIRALRSPLYSK